MTMTVSLYLAVSVLVFIVGYCLGKKAGYRSGLKISQLETKMSAISDTTRILLGRHRCTSDCSTPCLCVSETEIQRLRSLIENRAN